MNNEQAIRIARNFLLQREGIITDDVFVKSAAPANGKITVCAQAIGGTEDDNKTFEIELEPLTDAITFKEIKSEHTLSEYQQDPIQLCKLRPGDRFRMQYDCMVYTYIGKVEDGSDFPYIIERADGRGTPSMVGSRIVYPLGK